MIARSLWSCVTFSLCVIILFSTEHGKKIKISQTTSSFKLYDFLIYPSNDGFKYHILPFLSCSENLLKIFFHFQKLNPNVKLEKVLPNSIIKQSVLDLQNSPFAYRFQDEYEFFNPILYSENNYKTCTINDKNINEDSVWAFFPSNKIFLLKTYVLRNKQKVYANYNEENGMFFVAIKTDQGTMVAISRGNIKNKIKFPNYLDNILDAHNLTCFSKFYFKVFNYYQKYKEFVWKIWYMLFLKFDSRWTQIASDYMGPSNPCAIGFVCSLLMIIFIHLFWRMVLYHAYIFPFHIVSIPFEILFKNHFIIFGVSHFFNFLIYPCVFYSIFEFCFGRVRYPKLDDIQEFTDGIQIKPLKTMWVIPYLLQGKRSLCAGLFFSLTRSIGMFLWVLYSSLVFLPFFIIYGESQ